ncbi:MAG: hypothetical protein ACTSWC_10790 [Promethearchaeota archaeon]
MNYGIILFPLGLLMTAAGIGVGAAGAPPEFFVPILILGILIFFIGFARLVQGKERKILGKIIRPKAAARSSIVWALLFFNITPFILLKTEGIKYIFNNLPFPITILMSEKNVVQQYYSWVPAVFVAFHVIWLVSFFLSGKIPKIINIFMNFIITLSFSFWMSFGGQFLLWTFAADKTDLPFMDPWQSATTIGELVTPLIIGGVIIILSLVLLLRMIRNLQISFSNLNTKGKGGKMILSYIFLILFYIIAIFPLVLGIYNAIQSISLIVQYTNYISIVFLAIGIFSVITNLINTSKDMGKKIATTGTEGTGSKVSFGIMTAVYILVFILTWAPIFMPIVDSGQNSKSNSIYNPDWNGWSTFRTGLENLGYEVHPIQSSISTVSQLDPTKQVILVVGGPNVFYNPASEIPFLLTAFQTNFSIMICDDHGTAETLLTEAFIASMAATKDPSKATPLTFFPKGVLLDNDSFWTNPEFPVIQDFAPHDITSGISKVVLDHATGFLGGEFLSGFGWNFLGQTSGHYSFIDINGDNKYDQDQDFYPFPAAIANLLAGQSGTLGLMGTFLQQGIPLGGYAQAVFSSKEIAYHARTANGNGTFSSRIFVATDASWLDNQMVSLPGFDNLKMGLQAIDWLACDRSPSETIVVFDEAHIAPDSPKWNVGRTQISSAASFGAVQSYLNWMSTNPILALVYPIFALQTFRKWIPKEGSKKKLQLQDLEAYERDRMRLKFRTSSFFAKKINWYRQKRRYRKAILELFRRVERKVNRLLGDSGDRSLSALMRALRQEHGQYYSEDVYKRIEKFFEKMFKIKIGKERVRDEHEFELLFMEMSWVANKI